MKLFDVLGTMCLSFDLGTYKNNQPSVLEKFSWNSLQFDPNPSHRSFEEVSLAVKPDTKRTKRALNKVNIYSQSTETKPADESSLS